MRKSFIVGYITTIMVFAFYALLLADSNSFEVVYGLGKSLKVEKLGENKWQAKDAENTYVVEGKGVSKMNLSLNGKEIAVGKVKADKVKVYTPDNKLYMELKFKADKIKVTSGPAEDMWEFKYKGDKIKIVRGETKFGKVKFYPDSQKLKAKNASDQEVAVIRGVSKLSAAPAAFLIISLDQDKRNFLFLLLCALNK